MTTTAPPRSKRRLLRSLGIVLVAGLALWLLAGWAAIAVVTAPQRSAIAPLGTLAGAPVTDVAVVAADGVELRGWLVGASTARVVLLFAGIGGDRRSLTGLAEHYVGRGWSVLSPDLRATGESGGDRVGLGYLERLDVRAWIDFARARGFAHVALHGQSLGAAAITYALAESGDDRFDFVVLDGCYDHIRNALANRLPWIPLPGIALKPVEWFGAMALGGVVDDLSPARCVRSLRSPVLVVAGDADTKVLPAETERLFEACGSPDKQLRWIRGAGHTNLWNVARDAYARVLDEFMATLPAGAAAGPRRPSGR